MIRLADLPGIQHLLGDDAWLLDTRRDRYNETVVLVDTGRHRDRSGRYVTWIVGHSNCCLLGHYFNDRPAAIRDFYQRTVGFIPSGCTEQE